MGDFRLPEINVIPVDRKAGAFDRLGAEVQHAFSQAAETAAALQRSETLTQNVEATAKVAEAKAKTQAFLDANPKANAEDLAAQFGGLDAIPPDLAKDASGAPRTNIPVHEYGPRLFNHVVDKSISDAAQGIQGEGWQTRFSSVAQMDSIPDRARVQAHATAMQQMDQSLRTKSAYESLVSNGQYGPAKAAADMIPNAGMRAAVLAKHDELVAQTETSKAIMSPDPAEMTRVEKMLEQPEGFDVQGQHVVLGRPEAEALRLKIASERARRLHLEAQAKEMAWKQEEQKTNDLISQFARISDQTGVPFAQVEEANRGYVGLPPLSGDIPGAPGSASAALGARLKLMREGGHQVSSPDSMAGWTGMSEEQLAAVQPDVMSKALTHLDTAFGQRLLGWWKTAREKMLDGKPLSKQAILAEVHNPEFLTNALLALNEGRNAKRDPTTPWAKLDSTTRAEVDNLRNDAIQFRLKNPDVLASPLNSITLNRMVTTRSPVPDQGLGSKMLEKVVDRSKVGLLEFGVGKEAASLYTPLSAELQLNGVVPTPDRVLAEGAQIINVERPLVNAAWLRAGETGLPPPATRVAVHGILSNPVSIAHQTAVKALMDKGITNPTQEQLVGQIIWQMPPSQGGLREKANADLQAEDSRNKYNEVKAAADARDAAFLSSIPKWKQDIYRNRDSNFNFKAPAGYAAAFTAAEYANPMEVKPFSGPDAMGPTATAFHAKWDPIIKAETEKQFAAHRAASDADVAAYEKYLVAHGEDPTSANFVPRVSFEAWTRYYKGKN